MSKYVSRGQTPARGATRAVARALTIALTIAVTITLTLVSAPVAADEAGTPPPAPAAPARVTLTVTAEGFKSAKGQALVAVYDASDRWLKIDKALRIVRTGIDKGRVQVTFSDLPPGVYAVSVIHDENTNGKLDMHWFPIPGPDEGAGVSNDATASLGPPKWGDARFRLGDRGGVIAVKLRY